MRVGADVKDMPEPEIKQNQRERAEKVNEQKETVNEGRRGFISKGGFLAALGLGGGISVASFLGGKKRTVFELAGLIGFKDITEYYRISPLLDTRGWAHLNEDHVRKIDNYFANPNSHSKIIDELCQKDPETIKRILNSINSKTVKVHQDSGNHPEKDIAKYFVAKLLEYVNVERNDNRFVASFKTVEKLFEK